jgi:hypothetical protein
MSLAAWYLHKVDQCARRARDAAEPSERCRFESERKGWLLVLSEETGAEAVNLEIAIALEAQLARRSLTE